GRDLAAAIRFLESRGIHTVGLWGFSMGGAVALMEAPHRSQVQAVVSDSSYASLAAMVSEIYPLPLLRRPLGAITNLWGWLLFGFHPRDVSPEKSARDIEVPVLIIHSQNDDVIPFSHALKIQEGLSEKPNARIWFRQQALHGEIDAEYQDRVLEFFKESFSRPK
ncbi:MAG: prolyl oligopeptidase family serine peptidase, partial [bacterium]|nr:prolyl oligopeptidase family serine peptidase [bacterium]